MWDFSFEHSNVSLKIQSLKFFKTLKTQSCTKIYTSYSQSYMEVEKVDFLEIVT